MDVQASNLARFITTSGECHKGVCDVINKDDFSKHEFLDKEQLFSAQTKASSRIITL